MLIVGSALLVGGAGCTFVGGLGAPSDGSGTAGAAGQRGSGGEPGERGRGKPAASRAGGGGVAQKEIWPGASGTCQAGGEHAFVDVHDMGDPAGSWSASTSTTSATSTSTATATWTW